MCWLDRNKEKDMVWRPVESRRKHREYPWTLGSMQVYASYRYRRDLVEAVKTAGALTRTRPLVVRRATACGAAADWMARCYCSEDRQLMLLLPSQDAELVLRWADAGRGQHKAVEMDEVMLCSSPTLHCTWSCVLPALSSWRRAFPHARAGHHAAVGRLGARPQEHPQRRGPLRLPSPTALLAVSFGVAITAGSVSSEVAYVAGLAAQAAKVEEELRADSGVEVIRDLRLSVKPIRRRARLVYFPAYVIRYTFGEHFNTAGERRPNKHLAIVGGIGVPRACLAFSLLVPAA